MMLLVLLVGLLIGYHMGSALAARPPKHKTVESRLAYLVEQHKLDKE